MGDPDKTPREERSLFDILDDFRPAPTLRKALELCNGEDIRLNGCACGPGEPCFLHGNIVRRALEVAGG